MKLASLRPDQFTLTSGLNPCANLMCPQCGVQVQYKVIKVGFESNSFPELALIEMYVKCDRKEDAIQVFDHICVPNVFTWNSLVVGYARCSRLERAR